MKDNNELGIRPFEWLTDSASVVPLVRAAVASPSSSERHEAKRLKILHVGSGSSVLGEHLVETMGDDIERVVNVDVDAATLQRMKQRWDTVAKDTATRDKLDFCTADFAATKGVVIIEEYPSGYFDICIDKSTLDCTLCSDSASAGLLTEVYRLLNPSGGIYICISFHHLDLLQPLLQNLPGAHWDVSHTVMQRQVEDLIGNNNNKNNHRKPDAVAEEKGKQDATNGTTKTQGAWASGSFEPDEQYRRTVNVLTCRLSLPADPLEKSCAILLDREKVKTHINSTNDLWFQHHNPMLTSKRKETIHCLFQQQQAESEEGTCDLETAYSILFTEPERELLTFDLFLEDWQAWISQQQQQQKEDPGFPKDKMSVETALAFLEEMQ